jgi:hypothetical protein
VAHGPSGEDGGVTEEMRGHGCSLVTDDREEDVFE